MSGVNFNILNSISTEIVVQEHWNLLENAIVSIVDVVAPLLEMDCSPKAVNIHVPCNIKNLLNKSKRLLITLRLRVSSCLHCYKLIIFY